MPKDTPFPEIVTPRLRLRRFTAADTDGLHDGFSDADTMRFWNFPVCESKAETARNIAWLAKTTSPYDHLSWCIADKRTDRCMGLVTYHHRDARHKRLEIGFQLVPARQGQGLATEAVGALVEHCFSTLKVHRVHALVAPDNMRSRRLVERLGFVCEGGPMRDYWRVGDRYIDAMFYARLTDDNDSKMGASRRNLAESPQRKRGGHR